jgi:hypothetical protein
MLNNSVFFREETPINSFVNVTHGRQNSNNFFISTKRPDTRVPSAITSISSLNPSDLAESIEKNNRRKFLKKIYSNESNLVIPEGSNTKNKI